MARRRSAAPKLMDKQQVSKLSAGLTRNLIGNLSIVRHDDKICTAGEALSLVCGLPLPSFSMEYLTQNTVWPLGLVVQLVGPPGCCKSAFGFEVVRWFREASGSGTLFEHESKYSPDWALSILGWDQPDAMGHVPCDSIDTWQELLQWSLNFMKEQMLGDKKNKGPGRIFPYLALIDSLTGKSTRETQDKITKEGHAGRGHPIEAMSITSFLKKLPQDIVDWPFSVLAINHLKRGTDNQGKPVRGRPGGKHVEFQESFELELTRAQRWQIDLVDRGGMHLMMKCYKNAYGEGHRQIPVDIIWWEEEMMDPETQQQGWKQRTVWDWHGSTINLLLSFEGTKAKALREILDLNKVKEGTATKIWSKALGISKKKPAEYYEAGASIMEHPEVLSGLRQLFGIKVRRVFQSGEDFILQRRDAKVRIVEALRTYGKANGTR